jgi:hypothetical protein
VNEIYLADVIACYPLICEEFGDEGIATLRIVSVQERLAFTVDSSLMVLDEAGRLEEAPMVGDGLFDFLHDAEGEPRKRRSCMFQHTWAASDDAERQPMIALLEELSVANDDLIDMIRAGI